MPTSGDQIVAKILVVGLGSIGYRVASMLHSRGHRVIGLKRSCPAFVADFPVVVADICRPETLTGLGIDFDLVLFCVAPASRTSEAYHAVYYQGLHHLLVHFAASESRPKWLMVSSTSVYRHNRGEWVDETSPADNNSATARWLVAAEQRLWADNQRHCVVRFAGIYGPGRNWLLRRAARGERIQRQPPTYSNRIHADDCVGVLLLLAEKQLASAPIQSCYLACDDDPAPLWEVVAWLAERHGFAPPQALVAAEDAPTNKRCNNGGLKQLGYRFIYPSYREGYAALTASGIALSNDGE